jgi:hypothetical protein
MKVSTRKKAKKGTALCECLSEPVEAEKAVSLFKGDYIFKVPNVVSAQEAASLIQFANESGYATTFHEADDEVTQYSNLTTISNAAMVGNISLE